MPRVPKHRRRAFPRPATGPTRPRPAELFMEADADRSGFLDKREFTNVLNSAHLNLSDRCVQACVRGRGRWAGLTHAATATRSCAGEST
eukprot:362649-Chlamydomonas_euryale.AAC.2